MENNQQTYESKGAVEEYASHHGLQKGEQSILKQFNNRIIDSDVLDVGIGAGRTTKHLIPLAKQYVGIDYSQAFVEHCKGLFSTHANAQIQYGDARDLKEFADKSFDFIFFSFNGIDCVDMSGRRKILGEFSRLIKDDGILSFSFHNKGNLDKLYSFQYPRNPFKYPREWLRTKKIKDINGDKSQYKGKDWFIIKDGGENFTLNVYYAGPAHEQKLLEEFGFRTFYFHDAVSGARLDVGSAERSEAPWIYITATK